MSEFIDPLMAGDGGAAIDRMIAAVQERFPGYRPRLPSPATVPGYRPRLPSPATVPGYRFRRKGEVDFHHDRVRFGWELAPEGGPVFVDGTDFAVVADGKLATVTGFLDRQPGA